ncbi:AMP-binding protein [uncultured Pseudoteredinibacter sp.]|uniref:AMP-binding protein n=1 Tax=uncultured Pseudoteredinibacter sp. TaxID=1641701 RepID=UPI00260A9162|nr:AMP-binding protein [uncultured Pseudoteredinibacter sp.]
MTQAIDPNISHVVGRQDVSLIEQTIGSLLTEAAQKYPEREAIVACQQGVRWNYRELNQQAEQFAIALLEMGLEPGDRVGIWSPNNIEWVITQLATAKAGMVLVNINPAYRSSELAYALNKVECKALVLEHRFKTSNYVEMMAELAPEISQRGDQQLQSEGLPHLRELILIGKEAQSGYHLFSEALQSAQGKSSQRLESLATTLQADDPINIQFTSGTTGHPKGATLSHKNIVNNGYFVGEGIELTEQDRICIPVPLYHCFGMVMGVLAAISHGSCIVLPDEAFEAKTVLNAVQNEKCTALYGVPTMFNMVLDDENFSRYDLSSLRTGIMAGATCPVVLMNRVIAEMHMKDVTICYGMTETSPVSFQTLIGDSLEKQTTTVGQVHPLLEVRIVDENNQTVARGEKGEICTRGYSVMHGYWNDEEKTQEAIDVEGWMHTGDLGIIDSDGYCMIVGRLKDMIIRGGENVYPREVEEFLYHHEAIAEVQVFGIPSERFGEEVCAWVQLKPGAELSEDDIKEYCKGKIAHYKVPRYYRFVEEYPMTVTGKIQKFVMRDEMIQSMS